MSLQPNYKDSTLFNRQRADALLAEMSLEEKVAQIGGIWVTDLITASRKFVHESAQAKIPHGIGHITRISAAGMIDPVDSAKLANEIQKFLVDNTRLGIPAIVHEESCAGYTAKGATSFPQAIGLASTWEPELVRAMTQAIRKQMRAGGALIRKTICLKCVNLLHVNGRRFFHMAHDDVCLNMLDALNLREIAQD